MKNRIKLFVCVTLGFFVSWFIVGGINVAHAELKGGTIGLGTLSSLYCELTGCTMTGPIFSNNQIALESDLGNTIVVGMTTSNLYGKLEPEKFYSSRHLYFKTSLNIKYPQEIAGTCLGYNAACTDASECCNTSSTCPGVCKGNAQPNGDITLQTNGSGGYVYLDANTGTVEVTIGDASSTFVGDVDMDSALYVDSATGRIGINESSPGSLLTAVGYAANDAFFSFEVPDGDKTAGIVLTNATDSSEFRITLSADEKMRMTLSSDWSTTTNGMTLLLSGNTGLNSLTPASDLEIIGNLSTALAGTVAVTNGSAAVVGTGTAFTTALAVGDSVNIVDEIFTVSVITDATHLTLDSTYAGSTASGLTAYSDSDLFDIQNGDGVDALIVDKSGNVGINDSTPTARLDISGTARIEDSTTATCAADADDGVMYYRKIAGGSGLCICMFNGTTYELKATITLGTFTHSDC